jgi:hypothetical protein
MFHSLLLPFAVLAVSANAQASNIIDNTPSLVLSDGATTCGEYIAEPDVRTLRAAWVLGYISGRNRQAISPQDRMIGTSFDKPAALKGWLLNYCQSHSLDDLNRAADDLRAEFLKREQGR